MMRDLEFTSVRVGLQFCRNLFKSSVPFFSKKVDSLSPTLECPLCFRTLVVFGSELI